MKISEVLAEVEKKIEAEATAYHISAQVARFLRVTLVTFLAGLLAPLSDNNTTHFTWSALAAVITGAVETAFRQVWPTVSVSSAKTVAVDVVDEQLQNAAAETAKILGQPVVPPTPTAHNTLGNTST